MINSAPCAPHTHCDSQESQVGGGIGHGQTCSPED